MTVKQATIQCKNGLHLKVAGELARLIQKSDCKVWFISRGEKKIDASSVLQLLTLGARYGTKLKICVEGKDVVEETTMLNAVMKIIQEPSDDE